MSKNCLNLGIIKLLPRSRTSELHFKDLRATPITKFLPAWALNKATCPIIILFVYFIVIIKQYNVDNS